MVIENARSCLPIARLGHTWARPYSGLVTAKTDIPVGESVAAVPCSSRNLAQERSASTKILQADLFYIAEYFFYRILASGNSLAHPYL